jgi:predicted nucleotidyltransferase
VFLGDGVDQHGAVWGAELTIAETGDVGRLPALDPQRPEQPPQRRLDELAARMGTHRADRVERRDGIPDVGLGEVRLREQQLEHCVRLVDRRCAGRLVMGPGGSVAGPAVPGRLVAAERAVLRRSSLLVVAPHRTSPWITSMLAWGCGGVEDRWRPRDSRRAPRFCSAPRRGHRGSILGHRPGCGYAAIANDDTPRQRRHPGEQGETHMIGPSHASATSVHDHNDPPSTPCASIATTSSTSSTSFGGRNVRVFGSVTRGEAHSGSDVDLLIDVPAGTGLDTVKRIADALGAVLPWPVDVVTSGAARRRMAHVLDEAVPL